MKYWQGQMNWPISDPNWQCETCSAEADELVWGLVNGECRCSRCGTEYWLRDMNAEEFFRFPVPYNTFLPKYKEAFERHWLKFQKPLWEMTDNDWDEALKL